MISAWELGAMLYVPSTHRSLVEVGKGIKYPFLRSVAFCTEDAVRESEVPQGMEALGKAFRQWGDGGPRRFVRVRNPEILRQICQMPGWKTLSGFVLPKVNPERFDQFSAALPERFNGYVMLTLETSEVLDLNALNTLREKLCRSPYRSQIIVLRIGGNDLLSLLGLRRPRHKTIYSTPIGTVIPWLVMTFRPFGFSLSAPVCEYYDDAKTLAREVKKDLVMGLSGKTAIHPLQVPVIERHYRVSRRDLQAAERILSDGASAVFGWDGAMCEPATHRRWAEDVIMRAKVFGIAEYASVRKYLNVDRYEQRAFDIHANDT